MNAFFVRASFLSAVAAVVAAAVMACSSTATTTPSPNGIDSGATTAPPDSGSPADSGSGLTGDPACAAMATSAACTDCCDTNHQAGSETFFNAATACICGTGDAGADAAQDAGGPACPECLADLCVSQNPGPACSTCFQAAMGQGGSCVKPVGTACTADTDCLADLACINACPK
jgi:hypothetical protein